MCQTRWPVLPDSKDLGRGSRMCQQRLLRRHQATFHHMLLTHAHAHSKAAQEAGKRVLLRLLPSLIVTPTSRADIMVFEFTWLEKWRGGFK